MSHCSKWQNTGRGTREPPIYNSLATSTGDNMRLELAPEKCECGGEQSQDWAPNLWLLRSPGTECQNWVEWRTPNWYIPQKELLSCGRTYTFAFRVVLCIERSCGFYFYWGLNESWELMTFFLQLFFSPRTLYVQKWHCCWLSSSSGKLWVILTLHLKPVLCSAGECCQPNFQDTSWMWR